MSTGPWFSSRGGRWGLGHCPRTMPCPMPPCDAARGSSLGRWEPRSEVNLAEGPKWSRCLEVSEAGCPTRGRWSINGNSACV